MVSWTLDVEDVLGSQFVFLAVNASSGGGQAEVFLKLGFNHMATTTKDGKCVNLFIDDIRPGTNRDKTLFHLCKHVAHMKKAHNQDKSQTRIIVAGGDGTLMWGMNCIRDHGIDTDSCCIGILPFGTGNDYANAAGISLTGKDSSESYIQLMQRLIEDWIAYKPVAFDLWKVEIDVADSGHFKRIDPKTRKKMLIVESKTNRPVTQLNLRMANYFSVGIESKIGIGFDRNRTNSALINKGTYAMEGFKKFAFHRTRFINNFLKHIETHQQGRWLTICKSRPCVSRWDRVFGRKKSRDVLSEVDTHVPLLCPCVSLVMLNIPSFAGGLDLWRAATGKLALLKQKGTILRRTKSSFALLNGRSDTTGWLPGGSGLSKHRKHSSGDFNGEAEQKENECRDLKEEVSMSSALGKASVYEKYPSARVQEEFRKASGNVGVLHTRSNALKSERTTVEQSVAGSEAFYNGKPAGKPARKTSFLKLAKMFSSRGGIVFTKDFYDRVEGSFYGTAQSWDRLLAVANSDNAICVGDRKLECLCFRTLVELGLSNIQRIMPPHIAPGGAWRVCQSFDNTRLVFNELDDSMYFQIDGEYYIANRLKTVVVRHDAQMYTLVNKEKSSMS